MKKGILVVSFGTSYKETREKCIESIEKKIEKVYCDYVVKRAFTSNFIIKKLKERDRIYVDTPTEALNKLIESGVTKIYVQPIHVIPGYEYDKLVNAVLLVEKENNISITIGSPLLNLEKHYDEVIDALLHKLPRKNDDEGFILMGHGTEHYANACYLMLQSKISNKRDDIIIANVEGYPKIDDILEKIINKFDKITLMPFMIVAGEHAVNDMIGERNSFKSILEKNNIKVEYILEGLGQNEKIQDIFVRRISEIIK